MRTVLGYDADGRKVYSDNVPSAADAMRVRSLGGTFVTSEPDWREKSRQSQHRAAQRRYEAKKAARGV